MREEPLVSWRWTERTTHRVIIGAGLLFMLGCVVRVCWLSAPFFSTTDDLPSLLANGGVLAFGVGVLSLQSFNLVILLLNRTEVRLVNGNIVARHLPLWRRTRQVPLVDVTEFSSEAYRTWGNKSRITCYRIDAKLRSGQTVALLDRLDQEHARTVAKHLNELPR